MSEDGEDLAGESTSPRDASVVTAILTKEAWQFQWEKRLTWLTAGLIAVFYICLLIFIFAGHFRLIVGDDYWFFSSKPHLASDIPIIVALSTVPTVLLIGLLRYFHHRERKGDDDQSVIPLSAQVLRDLLKP